VYTSMDRPTILFLFNSSRYATDPWVTDGRFNVATVDYDRTDHSDTQRSLAHGCLRLSVDLSQPLARHTVDTLLASHGYAPPSLVVSFAPCTDLAVSGARHFERKRQADPLFQRKAVRMAQLAQYWGCPYIVENPVSVLSTLWRRPDVVCDPCDFGGWLDDHELEHPEFPGLIPDGDAYRKRTCLWLGHGAVAPTTRPTTLPVGADNPGWARLGGKSARTKYIRSLTPRGLARAIYFSNKGSLVDQNHDTLCVESENRSTSL